VKLRSLWWGAQGKGKCQMTEYTLHHASIVVSSISRSIDFYTGVLGLKLLERPSFKSVGAWFAAGSQQIHINEKPHFEFSKTTHFLPTGPHFALRVKNLKAVQERLEKLGYQEDSDIENLKRLVFDFHGLAGFPQLFLFDPDCNLVEINAERL
jgi:catechol 2,3-dioxygenase-like lactoylglutathione lyase family enzyme